MGKSEMVSDPIDLFVDDLRNPAAYGREGWVWARTVADAIDALQTRTVRRLSLDYDMDDGAYDCDTCRTGEACWFHASGADVAAWLVAHPERRPEDVVVHSANPRGTARLVRMLSDAGFEVRAERAQKT